METIKKILEEQLQLLSEKSKNVPVSDLATLSDTMARVAEAIVKTKLLGA